MIIRDYAAQETIERLSAELRRRDLEQCHRDARESQALQEVLKEEHDRVQAVVEAAELEEHRKRCWVNHHAAVAAQLAEKVTQSPGDADAQFAFLRHIDGVGAAVPTSGWPEGDGPQNYAKVRAWAPPPEPEPSLEDGVLGKALAACRPLKKI